eukprot:SAG11_NODE_1023_length_6154_cov_3.841288_3_plen_41_part_00
MVGVILVNALRAVELLEQKDPRNFMWPGHPPKRNAPLRCA